MSAKRAERRMRRTIPYRPATLSTDVAETQFEGKTRTISPNRPTNLQTVDDDLNFHGVHHVGLLCANLETSLRFYQDIIGRDIIWYGLWKCVRCHRIGD